MAMEYISFRKRYPTLCRFANSRFYTSTKLQICDFTKEKSKVSKETFGELKMNDYLCSK